MQRGAETTQRLLTVSLRSPLWYAWFQKACIHRVTGYFARSPGGMSVALGPNPTTRPSDRIATLVPMEMASVITGGGTILLPGGKYITVGQESI